MTVELSLTTSSAAPPERVFEILDSMDYIEVRIPNLVDVVEVVELGEGKRRTHLKLKSGRKKTEEWIGETSVHEPPHQLVVVGEGSGIRAVTVHHIDATPEGSELTTELRCTATTPGSGIYKEASWQIGLESDLKRLHDAVRGAANTTD